MLHIDEYTNHEESLYLHSIGRKTRLSLLIYNNNKPMYVIGKWNAKWLQIHAGNMQLQCKYFVFSGFFLMYCAQNYIIYINIRIYNFPRSQGKLVIHIRMVVVKVFLHVNSGMIDSVYIILIVRVIELDWI